MVLTYPRPYNLQMTALSHGWVNLSPFFWDEIKPILHRIERINDITVHCRIKQIDNKRVGMYINDISSLSKNDRQIVIKRLTRALNYNPDLINFVKIATINKEYDFLPIIEKGGGFFLRGTTLFEDIVKTVFTCNASWGYTKQMSKEMGRKYGSKCYCCGQWSFPDWQDIPSSLDIKIGYRKKTIRHIVEAYPDLLECYLKKDCNMLYDSLLKINGIGAYSAAHIMNLVGDYSRMPVDREIATFLGYEYNKKNISIIKEEYESRWGRWAFLAYKLKRITQGNNWIG